MADMVDCALVVMAKAPVPGKVKTRLCPDLSPEDASELYSCLLSDKIDQVRHLPGIHSFVALPEDVPESECLKLACGCGIIRQVGADLGARLHWCAESLLQAGYERVLLVDSDTPTLPPGFFTQAESLLIRRPKQVVLGPTTDGGYYLIGLDSVHGELFGDIPWSTSKVLRITLERASAAGIRTVLLPEWYDVDTAQDLMRLSEELSDSQVALAAPQTAAWVAEWKTRTPGTPADTRPCAARAGSRKGSSGSKG